MFQWTLISPEERGIFTGWLPDLIHTSCRSESSNISLVVLDKASLCPNATQARLESGMHFLGETSALVKPLRLSPGLAPSGRSLTCFRPQTWRAYVWEFWKLQKDRNLRQLCPDTGRPSVGWDLNYIPTLTGPTLQHRQTGELNKTN